MLQLQWCAKGVVERERRKSVLSTPAFLSEPTHLLRKFQPAETHSEALNSTSNKQVSLINQLEITLFSTAPRWSQLTGCSPPLHLST